jgi:signal transduction histidine kinase
MDAMEQTAADARQLLVGTADRGDAIELTVADRGSGIDAARHDSVFDSFYTTKPHGMGLGLSIVRAIVEAHHGEVAVEAREGGGTLFRVRLPRRRHATAAPAAQARPLPAPSS